MNPTRSLLLLAALPLIGCAETQYAASKPAIVFPSRAEVAQIPALPPRAEVFGKGDVAVAEWTVESPPLPDEGPYDDASPWGALLRDLTRTHADAVSLSPAMRCAASEIARFHLANHALPVERLRRFILARCGGETPNLAPYVWSVEASAQVTDAQILARARDALAGAVDTGLAHGHHLAGLAVARDATHATVALALGEDEARLESSSRSVDGSRRVTLRGRARTGYARISALVNRGDFGVSPCAVDPNVAPPSFALTCALEPGDSFDWVEVLGQERDQLLQRELASVLIYEGDASAVRFKPKAYGAPAPVTKPAEFTSALVDRVNGARSMAKLPPLTLAAKQSAENERLAGTLIDAAITHDDGSADKAAIGLLAGWDVDTGTIRNGEFLLWSVGPTRDAMAWLDSALEIPLGRVALLDPQARTIAVGPGIPDGVEGLGAAVTTYSFFESDDHSADEVAFMKRLAQVRRERGLPAPVRIETSKDTREHAARVSRNEETPLGALNEMLATQSWNNGAGAFGYVFETNDLATAPIPDVLLKNSPLGLSLAITHHRAPGAAWGQYVIFTLLSGGHIETPSAPMTPTLARGERGPN